MRKYWQAGLILLIVVTACSDNKKAEQATALKQEITDQLAKLAGANKTFTYGDVTVTPGDGDAFAVTIDKMVVPLPDAQPLDLGKVGFNLTPDGDDIRKYSDLTIPQQVTIKDTAGKEVAKINLALDHGSATWSKKLGLLDADVLVKSFDAVQNSSGDDVTATGVTYQVTSTDAGGGTWDQKASAGAKQIAIGGKDGHATIADFAITSTGNAVKLVEMAALRDQIRQAASGGKPEDMLPLIGKLFTLLKSFQGQFSVGNISVADATHEVFSMGSFSFDFGASGLDQPKTKITSGLRYAGMVIPDAKTDIGPAGSELLPGDFGIKIGADDVPLPAAVEIAVKNSAGADLSNESALYGVGMAMASSIAQALIQAATTVNISDGAVKAPAFTSKFDGQILASPAAAMGASGNFNIEVSDIDAIIAKVSSHSDDPFAAEITSVLQTMKGLSDRGTDASGKPIDRFKVTLDGQGNALINGKPMPTAQ